MGLRSTKRALAKLAEVFSVIGLVLSLGSLFIVLSSQIFSNELRAALSGGLTVVAALFLVMALSAPVRISVTKEGGSLLTVRNEIYATRLRQANPQAKDSAPLPWEELNN